MKSPVMSLYRPIFSIRRPDWSKIKRDTPVSVWQFLLLLAVSKVTEKVEEKGVSIRETSTFK